MTSPRFSVGQRVRVMCPQSRYHGEATRIKRIHASPNDDPGLGLFRVGDIVCALDLPHSDKGKVLALPPRYLIPVDDDRPEPGSWSELADIWKPEGVRC